MQKLQSLPFRCIDQIVKLKLMTVTMYADADNPQYNNAIISGKYVWLDGGFVVLVVVCRFLNKSNTAEDNESPSSQHLFQI